MELVCWQQHDSPVWFQHFQAIFSTCPMFKPHFRFIPLCDPDPILFILTSRLLNSAVCFVTWCQFYLVQQMIMTGVEAWVKLNVFISQDIWFLILSVSLPKSPQKWLAKTCSPYFVNTPSRNCSSLVFRYILFACSGFRSSYYDICLIYTMLWLAIY